MNGGSVVVDYIVNVDDGTGKGKGKAREGTQFDVFLPTFAVPVGRLEVIIEDVPGAFRIPPKFMYVVLISLQDMGLLVWTQIFGIAKRNGACYITLRKNFSTPTLRWR